MLPCSSLDDVRQYIDALDRDMVALLVARSHYVREAARFKKTREEILVLERVEEIVTKLRKQADILGGDPDLIEKIYRDVIEMFICHETAVWLALHRFD